MTYPTYTLITFRCIHQMTVAYPNSLAHILVAAVSVGILHISMEKHISPDTIGTKARDIDTWGVFVGKSLWISPFLFEITDNLQSWCHS